MVKKIKNSKTYLNWFYSGKLLTTRNNIFEKIYFIYPHLFRLKLKFSFTDIFLVGPINNPNV